jgi:hypothetical protein
MVSLVQPRLNGVPFRLIQLPLVDQDGVQVTPPPKTASTRARSETPAHVQITCRIQHTRPPVLANRVIDIPRIPSLTARTRILALIVAVQVLATAIHTFPK